jgi:hypothetical protein
LSPAARAWPPRRCPCTPRSRCGDPGMTTTSPAEAAAEAAHRARSRGGRSLAGLRGQHQLPRRPHHPLRQRAARRGSRAVCVPVPGSPVVDSLADLRPTPFQHDLSSRTPAGRDDRVGRAKSAAPGSIRHRPHSGSLSPGPTRVRRASGATRAAAVQPEAGTLQPGGNTPMALRPAGLARAHHRRWRSAPCSTTSMEVR